MFGKDRFKFESPNAIDPGELPPSPPSRAPRSSNPTQEDTDSCSVSTAPTDERRPYTMTKYNNSRDTANEYLQDVVKNDPPAQGINIPIDHFQDAEDPFIDEPSDEVEGPDEEGGITEKYRGARSYASSVLSRPSSRAVTFSDEHHPMLSSTKGVKTDSWRRSNRGDHLLTGPPIYDHHENQLGKSGPIYSKRQLLCMYLAPLVLLALVLVPLYGVLRTDSGKGSTATENGSHPNKKISERMLQTVDMLISRSVSSRDSLSVLGTPQNKAAQWIADIDPLRYTIPSKDMTSDEAYHFIQRYVLVLLYFATGGEDAWLSSLDFLSQNHECSWYHSKKFTDDAVYALGVNCRDAKLQVADILIPANGLRGSLPSELVQLSHLQLFSLSYNAISGTLPDLFELTNMEYFNMGNNMLSKTLPDWIGSWTNLKVLGLENNHFTGSLPASLSALSDLVTLDLKSNSLKGGIEVLNGLFSLEYLYLGANQLVDYVDEEHFLSDLQLLKEIDLGKNSFYGDVFPQGLLKRSNLELLDFSQNALKGSMPANIQENSVLKVLELDQNGFVGPIPSSIDSLRNLKHLDLSRNQITGYIPDRMVNMRNLTYLNLGENNFKAAPFPAFLSSFTQLQELSLARCNLVGSIPSWLDILSNLQFLNLQANKLLGGNVPEELWELPNLSIVLLSDTNLNGTIPSRPANIKNMSEFFHLHGVIDLIGDIFYVF